MLILLLQLGNLAATNEVAWVWGIFFFFWQLIVCIPDVVITHCS